MKLLALAVALFSLSAFAADLTRDKDSAAPTTAASELAQAQLDTMCIELIRRAMYDEAASTRAVSRYGEARRDFCRSSERSSRQGFGGGGLTAQSNDRAKEVMCDNSFSLERYKSNTTTSLRSISPLAAQIADNCIKAQQREIRFDVTYGGDDTMVVAIAFLPRVGSNQTSVPFTSKTDIPGGLQCSGALADVQPNRDSVTIQSKSMTCRRKNFHPFTVNNLSYAHPGGAVVVHTGAGPLMAILERIPIPPQAVNQSIAGQWLFGGNGDQPTVIADAGDGKLILTNEKNFRYDGAWTAGSEVIETFPAGTTVNGTLSSNSTLLLWRNGTWWSRKRFEDVSDGAIVEDVGGEWKFRIPPSATMIRPRAGSDLVVVNEKGQASPAKFDGDDTIDFAPTKLQGRLISGGRVILWSNGTWWWRP
jgi:hypothetical protein